MVSEKIFRCPNQFLCISRCDTVARRDVWNQFFAQTNRIKTQLSIPFFSQAMYFSTRIFEWAGLEGDWPKYATLAMGFINVLMTIVSVFLVDHPAFGRRTLHLASLGGMIACSIGLVIMLTLLLVGLLNWFMTGLLRNSNLCFSWHRWDCVVGHSSVFRRLTRREIFS